ncbi:hypothetical protein DFH06DRAFT_562918 [Mycena polygramma]|nr:hypothetical protein DFH06DRAFT_562918 [Mycena polygramma]
MTLPTFTSTTTAEEVAATFADQIRGKNVLITGTSVNGIGFETARVLAKYANLVIIAGYNTQRLKLAEEMIKNETPTANIRQLVLDLSSLAAVRKAAAEVNAYPEPLHALIHNAAAAGGGQFKLTVDNLETQIATDHIGPFLLTKLLAPKLLAAYTSDYAPRVVTVSSLAHAFGPGVDFATLAKPDAKTYKSMLAYAQAKSANILFAIELSKRSGGKIHGYSLHPGVIFTNGTQKEENRADLIDLGALTPDGKQNMEKFEWKTLSQGAATTVTATFDTRFEDKPGAYLIDCVDATDKIAPHTADPENAAKLWAVTEEIIGEKFNF